MDTGEEGVNSDPAVALPRHCRSGEHILALLPIAGGGGERLVRIAAPYLPIRSRSFRRPARTSIVMFGFGNLAVNTTGEMEVFVPVLSYSSTTAGCL